MSRRNKNQVNTEHVQSSIPAMDAFSNPLFRLGYMSQSPLEATEYPLTRLTDNYALLNSLYRDNWVVQNVVGIIPDDMTKEWFHLNGDLTPAHIKEFDRVHRLTSLRKKVNEGLRWGRLYGGAAGLILIRGQEDLLDKPLNLETVLPGTFAGLYILDRWCGITPDGELVSDLCDPDFGLPAYYTINGEGNCIAARVHHSRLVRFVGRELPYLERIAEMYWGESEVEALYSDVVKHDNVSANMAALTFRANTDIIEVQNLDQLFSVTSGEMQKRFWNTMQAQSVMKSNFGMQLVNKGDQMHNTQYTFSGLQEVYDSMCLDLAGASRIPVTKLFGRSPAGMNATGESDLRNYYDYVDTLRESQLRPVLEKLLPVLAMSAWGEIPEGLEITFPPLWTPTAKEVSEIAKAKTETVVAAFQAGLVDQSAAQRELKKLAEETGLFDSITEQEIEANAGKTYQDVTALQDPLLGLSYETPQEEAGEKASPFEQSTGDSLALDYNKNHDPSNGRFTSGSGGGTIGGGASTSSQESSVSSEEGLTTGGENGKTESSQKVIGKNGGTLKAEDIPEIRVSPGKFGKAEPGTKVTKIYTFAGKETQKPLRVEQNLIKQYGGQKGQWQHTTGDVVMKRPDGKVQTAEVHWFQESSIGIVGAKVKRWR